MTLPYYLAAMQRTGEVMKPQTFLLALAGLLLLWAVVPISAHAAELSTQTAQVIPPGGNGCPAITATNFVAYVYDNTLNSFDFTVSDPAYVALAGSVGETGVPFNQMTRMLDAQGQLKMHVDIASAKITGTLPITVTLLSARPNQPVCVLVVSTTLTAPSPIPTPAAPAKPIPPASTPKPEAPQKPAPSGAGAATSAQIVSGSFASSIGQAFKNACATPVAAQRTWLVLLLAYTLIVGLALWAEFPMSLPMMRTPERVAGIILALLLALLAFWYFSASCRTALWMPLVAVLIAVLGLLAAFRNHPRVTQLLLIQSTRISS